MRLSHNIPSYLNKPIFIGTALIVIIGTPILKAIALTVDSNGQLIEPLTLVALVLGHLFWLFA